MSASTDGSESVDQFLARIASLSNKQGSEDAERSKRMEEEMLQARRERQARRAERARSISPVKTGPAAAPSYKIADLSTTNRLADPPVSLAPRSQAHTPSRPDFALARPSSASPSGSPTIESSRPLPPPPLVEKANGPIFSSANANSLSRSGTLSWQQRPLSREFGSVRSRPISPTKDTNRGSVESAGRSSPEKQPEELSRKDIAASLATKDPAWFRQTQDRGVGSAAYRKADSMGTTVDHQSIQGVRLPGMLPETPVLPPIRLSPSASSFPTFTTNSGFNNKVQDAYRPGEGDSIHSTEPKPVLSSSPVSKAQSANAPVTKPYEHLQHPETDEILNRSPSILSTAGRPPSPTKGLGGFVQSAMMKRSDSVNKRWSVQANAGLKRGDSVAGNRPTFTPSQTTNLTLGQAQSLSRDPGSGGDGVPSLHSGTRPSPSHEAESIPSDLVAYRSLPTDEPPHPYTQSPIPDTAHARADERPSTPSIEGEITRSPSKTLDPRRWSPTKSSWLESALSKPESPRPALSRPDPPAWKLDMQRMKTDNETASATQPASFEPVSTGGLLRSPPMGTSNRPTSGMGMPLTNALSNGTVQPTSKVAIPRAGNPAAPTKPDVLRQALQPTSTVANDAPLSAPQADFKEEEAKIPPGVKPKPVLRPFEQGKTKEEHVEKTAKPDFRLSADKKPPVLRPKPETPPKIDFRANLKSRQTGSANTGEKEPEFKAVFGKLKRAQTQNYVAPDELKANITKGKAALNATGGPQKTTRVDEFKESILQRKEAMKAGGGSIHTRSESASQQNRSLDKAEPEIPEALARRKTLHRTSPTKDGNPADPVIGRPLGEMLDRNAAVIGATTSLQKVLNSPARSAVPSGEISLEKEQLSANPTLVAEAKAVLTNTATEDAVMRTTSRLNPKHETPEKQKAAPLRSPSPKKEPPESSKLASRLNPGLADLFSRTGSPRLGIDAAPSTGVAGVISRDATPDNGRDPDSGTLTHVTKGRAKGPKRRAPKTESLPAQPRAAPKSQSVTTTFSGWPQTRVDEKGPLTKSQPLPSAEPELQSNSPEGPAVLLIQEPVQTQPTDIQSDVNAKARPTIVAKSPELRKISNPLNATKVKEQPATESSMPKKFDIATDHRSPESPTKMMKSNGFDTLSHAGAASMPLTPSKSKINSSKPPKPVTDTSNKSTSVKTDSKPNGLGLDLKSGIKRTIATPELTPPPDMDVKSIPVRGVLAKPDRSSVDVSHTRTVLEKFFDIMPRAGDRAEFDTEAFLAAQDDEPEKIRTISKQVWEVNGDGKTSAMPPYQEHILFEDSMYLCSHSFELPNGSKSCEVYLWCGDAVGEAAVEDAQLFCRKTARENNAKLAVIKQGKETSRFFQALGGIVITRKNKSSALYMLCGRRHLGHVAFDEVDLSSSSLCSGYVFIISAKFGKLYLWKGHGSGADEVGAARLIGMDLGLTGEIEEIQQGEEPAAFWDALSTTAAKSGFQSSLMWSTRSASEHRGWPTRLYRVEYDRPKSSGGFWGLRASSPPKSSTTKACLQEISPFCQKDLEPAHVYILDAYAHVYVMPGLATSSKSAEFVTAMHIAQEIALLTPSVQDRSLLPMYTAVFGEPPHDFTAAFRKWVPVRHIKDGVGSTTVEIADAVRNLD